MFEYMQLLNDKTNGYGTVASGPMTNNPVKKSIEMTKIQQSSRSNQQTGRTNNANNDQEGGDLTKLPGNKKPKKTGNGKKEKKSGKKKNSEKSTTGTTKGGGAK